METLTNEAHDLPPEGPTSSVPEEAPAPVVAVEAVPSDETVTSNESIVEAAPAIDAVPSPESDAVPTSLDTPTDDYAISANDQPIGEGALTSSDKVAETVPAEAQLEVEPVSSPVEAEMEQPVAQVEEVFSSSSDDFVEHAVVQQVRSEEAREAEVAAAEATLENEAAPTEESSATGALVIQPQAEFSNVNERIELGKDQLETLAEEVSGFRDELKRANADISALKEQVGRLSSRDESSQHSGEPTTSTSTEPQSQLAQLVETPSTAPSGTSSVEPSPVKAAANQMDFWISRAMAHETESLKNDVADFNRYSGEGATWAKSSRDFVDALGAALPVFETALANAETSKDALSGHLKDKAESALKGLRLTHTMLMRASERARDLATATSAESAPIEPISRPDWEKCLAGVTDNEEATKRVRARFTEAENARYKRISEARSSAESGRKKLLGFIEKQMLPICDGVEDGRRHAATELERVRQGEFENDATRANFEAWFGVFGELGGALRNILSLVGVETLQVQCGQPIDYNTQEPFETVADASMQTEDVAEVVRHGYVYQGADGAQIVLRPAQVVVVKN